MKRLFVPLIVVAGLGLAAAPAASASPFNRNCATPHSGFLFGPVNGDYQPWEVNGPWHINMASKTAYLMARRWPRLESGYRVSATRDVPCWVARSIAEHAAQAWQHWLGNSGFVTVSTTGMGPPQYVGRFSCSGDDLPAPNVARLTCHNRARTIYGSFTISENPTAANG